MLFVYVLNKVMFSWALRANQGNRNVNKNALELFCFLSTIASGMCASVARLIQREFTCAHGHDM